MIIELQQDLETRTGYPVHFVSITEEQRRPCLTIRKSSSEHKQSLNKATGIVVAGVEIEIYADDYLALEEATAAVDEHYNGQVLTLGGYECKFLLDDQEDDSFPPPANSDDWIYWRKLSLRVHYKKIVIPSYTFNEFATGGVYTNGGSADISAVRSEVGAGGIICGRYNGQSGEKIAFTDGYGYTKAYISEDLGTGDFDVEVIITQWASLRLIGFGDEGELLDSTTKTNYKFYYHFNSYWYMPSFMATANVPAHQWINEVHRMSKVGNTYSFYRDGVLYADGTASLTSHYINVGGFSEGGEIESIRYRPSGSDWIKIPWDETKTQNATKSDSPLGSMAHIEFV